MNEPQSLSLRIRKREKSLVLQGNRKLDCPALSQVISDDTIPAILCMYPSLNVTDQRSRPCKRVFLKLHGQFKVLNLKHGEREMKLVMETEY